MRGEKASRPPKRQESFKSPLPSIFRFVVCIVHTKAAFHEHFLFSLFSSLPRVFATPLIASCYSVLDSVYAYHVIESHISTHKIISSHNEARLRQTTQGKVTLPDVYIIQIYCFSLQKNAVQLDFQGYESHAQRSRMVARG